MIKQTFKHCILLIKNFSQATSHARWLKDEEINFLRNIFILKVINTLARRTRSKPRMVKCSDILEKSHKYKISKNQNIINEQKAHDSVLFDLATNRNK
jgi:hypothetical protein